MAYNKRTAQKKAENRNNPMYESFMDVDDDMENADLIKVYQSDSENKREADRHSLPGGKKNSGTFADDWNVLFHFSYDYSQQKYKIPDDDLDKLCDLLNQNTPDDFDILENSPEKKTNPIFRDRDRSIESEEHTYRSSFMAHRSSTITLMFTPFTKSTVQNFLRDLVSLRKLIERKNAAMSNASLGHTLIDDEYKMIPKTTTLTNFQASNETEEKGLKNMEKCIPCFTLLMIICGVCYFVFKKQLHPMESWILLIAFFLGLLSITFLMIYKCLLLRRERKERLMERWSSIGRDPKIQDFVYRFNKSRLRSRKASAVISSDCDLLSIEVKMNVDQEGFDEDLRESDGNSFYYK